MGHPKKFRSGLGYGSTQRVSGRNFDIAETFRHKFFSSNISRSTSLEEIDLTVKIL